MERDVELDTWRRQWRTASAVPADLKERVAHETRTMRRFVVAEVLVTVLMGGGGLAWAVRSRQMDALVLAVGIWIFIAVAWTMSLLLRRGAWTPVTATTTAFLELSILRCRRSRDAIVAQCALYVLILTFDLVWIYFDKMPRPADPWTFLTSGSIAWVWVVTAALGLLVVRQRRKLGRELENLTALQKQVESRA